MMTDSSYLWNEVKNSKPIHEIINLIGNKDINEYKMFNETLLFHAVRCNNKELVEFLIEKGIKLESVNNKGETALFYVEDTEILDIFVKAKANLNHIDIYRTTVLSMNCARGDIPMIKELLRLGVNVDSAIYSYHRYRKSVVKLLLEHNINPGNNVRLFFNDEEILNICLDKFSKEFLYITCYDIRYIFKYDIKTIEKCIDIFGKDIDSIYILDVVENDRIDIIKLFIKKGIKIEEVYDGYDENNCDCEITYIYCHCEVNSVKFPSLLTYVKSIKMVDILIDNGIDVDEYDNLVGCFLNDDLDILQRLIQKGLDINENKLFREDGRPIADGYKETLFLIENGVSVDYLNKTWKHFDSREIRELYLKSGISCNINYLLNCTTDEYIIEKILDRGPIKDLYPDTIARLLRYSPNILQRLSLEDNLERILEYCNYRGAKILFEFCKSKKHIIVKRFKGLLIESGIFYPEKLPYDAVLCYIESLESYIEFLLDEGYLEPIFLNYLKPYVLKLLKTKELDNKNLTEYLNLDTTELEEECSICLAPLYNIVVNSSCCPGAKVHFDCSKKLSKCLICRKVTMYTYTKN